jgi:molybdopterin-guanine dinucleotide biosynthesis protein A
VLASERGEARGRAGDRIGAGGELLVEADVTLALVDRRRSADADVAVPIEDGHPQWTHGVWHRRCSTPLEARFGMGVRSLYAATQALDVVTVPAKTGLTRDADRPEDLPDR